MIQQVQYWSSLVVVAHVSDGGCRDLCFAAGLLGNAILGSTPISSSSRACLTCADRHPVQIRLMSDGITMRHVAVAHVSEVVQCVLPVAGAVRLFGSDL